MARSTRSQSQNSLATSSLNISTPQLALTTDPSEPSDAPVPAPADGDLEDGEISDDDAKSPTQIQMPPVNPGPNSNPILIDDGSPLTPTIELDRPQGHPTGPSLEPKPTPGGVPDSLSEPGPPPSPATSLSLSSPLSHVHVHANAQPLVPSLLDPPDLPHPRALSDEELDRAKSLVLDLLGWGVEPEYLVECGVSAPVLYRIFTDLRLRLPTNLAYFG